MSYITALILSQLTWDLSLVYHNTFLLQVAKAAGKDLGQEILEHFKVRMAPSIVVLQAAGHTPTGSQGTTPSSCGVSARQKITIALDRKWEGYIRAKAHWVMSCKEAGKYVWCIKDPHSRE